MLDRDPAPEGFEGRCAYCGRPLAGQDAEQHIPAYGDTARAAVRFCSEACAKAYAAAETEETGEPEPIYRAGAT